MKRFLAVTAHALVCFAATESALAQPWPLKPVRLVIAFPGGSAADTSNRVIAERVQARLGQNIVIENRPGAGGLLGAQYTLMQPADGYTFTGVSAQMSIRSAAPNPPFDVRRDFAHVVAVTDTHFFLAVNAARVPAHTLKELLDWMRAHPGEANFSSYGTGTLGHLSAELLLQMTGVKAVHVPYNGSVANSLALSRGDGHVTFDVLSSLRAHLDSGKVRLIAAASQGRSSLLPELPGMTEAGLPGFHVVSITGISARVGVGREIVERMNAAYNEAMKEPAIVERSSRLGFVLVGGTPAEFAAHVERTVATFSRVIREAKITLE